MNDITFFIIWLIGAIFSTYIIFKYVKPITVFSDVYVIYKDNLKLLTFIYIVNTFIIVFYILISWLGAIITYSIFKQNN